MRNISQYKQDKDIIKELYVRAVANILYYEKRFSIEDVEVAARKAKEEMNKIEDFKLRVWIKPHNENGNNFDLPSKENDRYRGGMHLWQVAKLLTFLIGKVQDNETKILCYQELVIYMIDNIVTDGGCYSGYINRLGLSVLSVDMYMKENLQNQILPNN